MCKPISPANADSGIMALVGDTPILPLRFEPEGRTVHAKCEFLNPSGSIKDRLARSIIMDAEKCGLLRSDSIILECTSGNTGISLAMLGAARGYRVTILMSRSASVERQHLIRGFGAELILFETGRGYETGIEISREMAARDPRYFLPRQFENPLNALDHEHETAVEIAGQVRGPIAAFASGYGTGGTLAGIGKGLKRRYPDCKIIAMEPAEAALLCGEMPCCHSIEGISGGFIPPLLQSAPIDGERKVSSHQALEMTRRLHREFGLMVGTSSGANVAAALSIARELAADACVVTILCDRAERYFSTRLFRS